MSIVDFLFETGQLKRQNRSGWSHLGIKHSESIADHSWRTAVIAFVLAEQEGLDAEKAATIAVFHELGEARIGDLDKVQQRYFKNKKEAEAAAVTEQLSTLPESLRNRLSGLIGDFEGGMMTPEQEVVRDADFLECMLQAKEYMAQGFSGAANWLHNAETCLKTEHAKKLAKQIIDGDPNNWYLALKKIGR
jgi:putative hydrolase of HD superfamily